VKSLYKKIRKGYEKGILVDAFSSIASSNIAHTLKATKLYLNTCKKDTSY